MQLPIRKGNLLCDKRQRQSHSIRLYVAITYNRSEFLFPRNADDGNENNSTGGSFLLNPNLHGTYVSQRQYQSRVYVSEKRGKNNNNLRLL